MPATDPAKLLARELIDLRREVRSTSRASQGAFRSLEVDGETVALPDVVRDGREAHALATTALTAANGKNTVTYSPDPASPATPGSVEGDIWWQVDPATEVIIGSWLWSGTSWDPHTFGDTVIDTLTAAKITTGILQAGVRIIAGPANGTHAEVSDTGFRVFASDPVDGTPNEVIRLGTDTDDYFGIVNADGTLAASVDQSGYGSFRGISVKQWPEINAVDHTGRGGNLLDILDRRPRGLVGWGARYTDSPVSNTVGGVGVFDIDVTMHPHRMYRLSTSPLRVASTSGGEFVEVQIRYTFTKDGSQPPAPTINSPIMARAHTTVDNLNGETLTINKLFRYNDEAPGDQPRRYRLLVSFSRISGAGVVALWAGTNGDAIELFVEDIGLELNNLQVVNAGGGGVSGSPTRQTITVPASWARSYRSDGQLSFDGAIYQGYGDSFNGAQRALIGFPDLTGNLAGATVEAVGLFLYAEHWGNNEGGTAIIGRHSMDVQTSNYPPPSQVAEHMTSSSGWPKPGGRWIDLTPFDPQGWLTGTVRGIVLGSTGMSTSPEYYGRFAGPNSGSPPLLNITFTK